MVAEKPQKTVNDPDAFYEARSQSWPVIDALASTRAMRKAAKSNLDIMKPLGKEEHHKFCQRIDETVLFPAYANATRDLANRPFTRDVIVENLPEQLDYVDNVDGANTTVTDFAKSVYSDLVTKGWLYAMVDMPPVGEEYTLADEQALGVRPMFVRIEPKNLIGYRSMMVGGREVVTQVRIREMAIVEDGEFGQNTVDRVRVINGAIGDKPGSFQVWQETKSDDGKKAWGVIEQGPFNYPQGVPIVAMSAESDGNPPMEHLAWLNVDHFRSSSLQTHYLSFARVGMLTATGVKPDELAKELRPGVWLHSANKDAKFGTTEFDCTAIDAGARDLEHREQQMSRCSLEPLVSKHQTTATEQDINEKRQASPAQAWAKTTERALRQLYSYAATWIGVELADDFKCDVDDKFTLSQGDAKEIKDVYEARLITHRTALHELVRRGTLDENTDIEAEIEGVQAREGSEYDHIAEIIESARSTVQPLVIDQ